MSKFQHYSPQFKAHRLFATYATAVAIMDSECKPNSAALTAKQYNDAYDLATETYEQINLELRGFVNARSIFG